MKHLHEMFGEYALVCKVDVHDVDASLRWYESKLGLVHDPRFDSPGWWAQLNVPGLQRVAIGLNHSTASKAAVPDEAAALDEAEASKGPVTTFVVINIDRAKAELEAKGVKVTKPETVPHGVQLAYFHDPDGNRYGLRQNPLDHPAPTEIGAQ